MLFFIRCNASHSHGDARLWKQRKAREIIDNNPPIGKQHADNQWEVDSNHKVRKGEKEEETGKKRIN